MKTVRWYFHEGLLESDLIKKSLPIALFVLSIFFLPSTSAAKLYRWVDDKGISHFSSHPPTSEVAVGEGGGVSKNTPEKKKLYDFREKVVKVTGLDTIELASGRQVKYIGVKSPKVYLKQTGRKDKAEEAVEFHSKLVKGKIVTVILGRKKKDKQGRYLGHVFLGQQAFINAELIRQGHALTEEYPSDFEYQSLFIRLLKDAQEKGRGIWKF